LIGRRRAVAGRTSVVGAEAARAAASVAALPTGIPAPRSDYRLALQAAQGKLATQESVVARIGRQIEAAQADVVRAQAALDAAHADVTHAEAEFARQSELRRSDFGRRPRFAAPRRPSPPSAPTSTF
jgi:membrane fusion protein (multidrug efflux system)